MGGSGSKGKGQWSAKDVPDLNGMVAVVTGATAGIGLETSKVLAAKKAHVILAGRSQERLDTALHKVKASVPEASVEGMLVDLANLTSVKRFAETFHSKHRRLNILVDNAGIGFVKPAKTPQGFDVVIGTNHFGTFCLTQQLLPALLASAPSRVVVLSAAGEAMAPPIDWDDIGGCKRQKSGMAEVSLSKLYNGLYARALQARVGPAGVSVFAVHPGLIKSDLYSKGDTSSGFLVKFIRFITALMGVGSDRGATAPLYAATSPELEGKAGRAVMYGPNNWMRNFTGERKFANPQYTAENAERLFAETLRLVREKGFTEVQDHDKR